MKKWLIIMMIVLGMIFNLSTNVLAEEVPTEPTEELIITPIDPVDGGGRPPI